MATRNVALPRTGGREAAAARRWVQTVPGLGFLAPFLVLYLLFLVGPMAYGLLMSFFDTSMVQSGFSQFIGVQNYAEALTTPAFWGALWHTILFTVMTTPPLVVLGMALAILADRVRRGRWFFRLVFFAPYVLPSSVLALIWVWMYTPEFGLFSSWLSDIGIHPPTWLGDPNWAMWSVAMATIWWTLGFNFVLYLAGLQEIPAELYDAASIDGAGPLQQITRVTVPMLGRTTTLVAVLQVIASLKIFDQIYLMTGGGPGNKTRPAVQYIYDMGFVNFRVGYASAVSVLLFLVILVVSLGWFALVRRQEKGA